MALQPKVVVEASAGLFLHLDSKLVRRWWIGGGLEALPDGLQYLKSYVDWRAATNSSMTSPPLMQVWLLEGEVALPPGN